MQERASAAATRSGVEMGGEGSRGPDGETREEGEVEKARGEGEGEGEAEEEGGEEREEAV